MVKGDRGKEQWQRGYYIYVLYLYLLEIPDNQRIVSLSDIPYYFLSRKSATDFAFVYDRVDMFHNICIRNCQKIW